MNLQTHRKSERMFGVVLLGLSFLPIGAGVLVLVAGFSAPTFSPWLLVLVGLCLFLFLAAIGLSAFCFSIHKIFPSTLRVHEGKIQYLARADVLGQIPLANVMRIEVLRPEEDGSTAGGLAGAQAALRNAEGIGIAFVVYDEKEKDTFWPNSMKLRDEKFKIVTRFAMTYQGIHDVLLRLLPNLHNPEKEFVPPPNTEPEKKRSKSADSPPANDNPFNFG